MTIFSTTQVEIIHLLDLFGTGVFAITGSLAAGKKRMDVFGVLVLGLATAIGGGTLRDLLLGRCPVFWIINPNYLIVVITACVLTLLLARFVIISINILLVFDALGLAVFTVVGMVNSLSVTESAIVAAIMGIITGVAGGILRDTLSAEVPLILRKEIYAAACLGGAVAYLGLFHAGMHKDLCIVISILITLSLRLAAIRWNLSLPVFAPNHRQNDSPKQ